MATKNITCNPCITKRIIRGLFFIGSWILLWLTQGDILYQMEENSLWILGFPAEFDTLLIPSDIPTYISRFILTIFTIPWLGTLFLAIILSVTEILTDATLRLKPSLMAISYIPSFAIMGYIYSIDYRIYCYYENSNYIKVILIILIIVALLSLTSRVMNGKKRQSTAKITLKSAVINILVIAVAVFCCELYGARDMNFRTLAKLKTLTENNKWSRMARIAEKVEYPNRPVAAYHAIALAQMGQVGERLFKIHHDYTIYTPKNEWEQDIENGGYTFVPEMELYSGLTQSAYHHSMEQMIICGHCKHYIKIMIKAAVINRDKDVAEKLMSVLERCPFEKGFVKRMRKLNNNPDQISADLEFAPVVELIPKYDSFEQTFGNPLFLTFYNNLSNGTDRALDLSLTACLYMKSIPGFASRCGVLADRKIIPKHFQEALVMLCKFNNPSALQQFNISHDIYSNVTEFYNELDKHQKDKDLGKAAMKDRFGKTYMFYNTFENMPKK